MAIKRYPTRYVKSYLYKDPHSGEEEDIVFMANGHLFPLFKSCTGVELGTALSDYKKSLLTVVNKETVELIGKFEAAKTEEEKTQAVLDNPELIVSTIKQAQEADDINGLSMIEHLLIVMHVCALPEDEQAEALAIGYEILPQEVYEDPTLALELLDMAMTYESIAKKNSRYRKR